MKTHPATVAALLCNAATAADQLTQARDEAGVVTLLDARLVVANTDDADDVVIRLEPVSERLDKRVKVTIVIMLRSDVAVGSQISATLHTAIAIAYQDDRRPSPLRLVEMFREQVAITVRIIPVQIAQQHDALHVLLCLEFELERVNVASVATEFERHRASN